jgi:subtilisin family serine protease
MWFLFVFHLVDLSPHIFTLPNGNIIQASSSPSRRPLLSSPDSWYYLHYHTTLALPKYLPSLSILSPHWAVAFLNSSVASHLASHSDLSLVQNTPDLKTIQSSDQNEYILQTSNSFNPPPHSLAIVPNLYVVTSHNISSFFNDPTVLSVHPVPTIRFMNRWASGYLQTGSSTFGPRPSGLFESTRVLNDRGINGSGVIVTVIDHGVDHSSLFFNDTHIPVPINRTDWSHRKIVRYDDFADSTFEPDDHGTHISGTIAGYATGSLNLYRGHAFGARLYVADIGDSVNLHGHLESIVLATSRAFELGNPIVSCSWATENSFAVRYTFDSVVYDHPEILYVFPAGNSGGHFEIGAPGASKNVLTVGSLSPLPGSDLGNSTFREVFLVSGDLKISVESDNLYDRLSNDPLFVLKEFDVVPVTESDLTGKLVVVASDSASGVANAIAKGAAAVIVFGTTEAAIPVIRAKQSDISAINNLRKASIVLNSSRAGGVSVSSFSSRGPSDTGLSKPEVVAPGESVRSAGAGPADLVDLSGTSVAVPAIAGSAALIAQYLAENVSRVPIAVERSGALLRAFIVQAASSDTPTAAAGFGGLALNRVLLLEEDFPTRGLRFVSGRLSELEEAVFTVNFGKPSSDPLVVTMTWIDVALPVNDTDFPLIVDLDLFIVGPSGSIVYGNRGWNNEEDCRSTTEKIELAVEVSGIYEIHVRANPSSFDNVKDVAFAVVVNGPFAHLDFDANPASMNYRTQKWESPHCGELQTGLHCQVAVTEFSIGQTVNRRMRPREFAHFRLTFPDNFDGGVEIHLQIGGSGPGWLRIGGNTGNEYKLQMSRFLAGSFPRSATGFMLSDLGSYKSLYLSAFWDFVDEDNLTLTWAHPPGPPPKSNTVTLILIIGGSILGVMVAIIVFVGLCYKPRRKHRRRKSLDSGKAQVIEDDLLASEESASAPASVKHTKKPKTSKNRGSGEVGQYVAVEDEA